MFRSAALLVPVLATTIAVAAEVETFTIKTLQAQMKYDLAEFQITPGANVKIIFENTDDMPHNLCFFQPGTDVVAVCAKQMEKPEEALKRNWLPEDPKMWLHSRMLNPKEKEEITFKAPTTPGIYPFVCTFPGHATTMQGKLKIAAVGPKISGLHFKMYLGNWKTLPKFADAQLHREGELDGLVEVKLDDYKNEFGVVYTGSLNAPKEAEYTFHLASDDGAALFIDGKQLILNDGIHPSTTIKTAKTKLTAGSHDFRLDYFQASGGAELYLAWSGADFALTPLSKWIHPNAKQPAGPKKDDTVGIPLVVGAEPVIYRNFIAGAGNRGIGVGYPGGFNIAWSAEQMGLALVWRGSFIDAARHWNSRGGGAQPPAGFDVYSPAVTAGPPFAVLSGGEWPKLEKKAERLEGYAWKGYKLDAKRFPTFFYEWNGAKISDRFDVEGEAITSKARLVRTIKVDGKLPDGAVFRAASADSIKPADGGFVVDAGKLKLGASTFDNRFRVAVEGGKVEGKNLVVPARSEIKLTYTWPSGHPETHSHAH